MRPKSSELFDQVQNPQRGLLVEQQQQQSEDVAIEKHEKEVKREEQDDENILEFLREEHLDSMI